MGGFSIGWLRKILEIVTLLGYMTPRHEKMVSSEQEEAPESEHEVLTLSERIARANARVTKLNEPLKEKTTEREIGRKLVLEMIRLQTLPKGRLTERLRKLEKDLEELPPSTDEKSNRQLLLKEIEVDVALIEAHHEEILELKEARQRMLDNAEAKKNTEKNRLHAAIGRGWLESLFHRFLPAQSATEVSSEDAELHRMIEELDDHIFSLEDEIETAEDAIKRAKDELNDSEEDHE